VIAETPRWPGGCLAGSFQSLLAGWSSVLRSFQFAPPSRLSKIPACSAPARSRPCAADRLDTFDIFSPSPSSSP
jgi:hypothetical protein